MKKNVSRETLRLNNLKRLIKNKTQDVSRETIDKNRERLFNIDTNINTLHN